jgi:F-type H+-transporting ATPase subunit alpha
MKDFKDYLEETGEIGYIESISGSVAYISGLPGLRLKETILTENNQKGIVNSLQKNLAEILMLDLEGVTCKMAVARTNENFKIPVGESFLGRVLDPLCRPIDGLGPIEEIKERREIEGKAPEIFQRARVKKFLETGVLLVDLLVPLGYGQRELVIGDEKTGKTTFLLQTLNNQTKKGVIGIYVSIGKKGVDIKNIQNYLKEQKILEKTIIIAATAASPASQLFLAPYSAITMAEFFRDQGKNVLIIFDDLTNHAKAYREISLITKKTPGRSSYPGDIFHVQAKLLERAGNIKNQKNQEVSITALPVASTIENDISGYIQTNLMAMTDGHLFFDSDEYKKGARPAINPFLSVSRVGNQTKKPMEHGLAKLVLSHLSAYKKAAEMARFGTELPEKTRKQIEIGEKLEILMNQESEIILERNFQILLLANILWGRWEKIEKEKLKEEINSFIKEYQKGNYNEITQKIQQIKNLKELQAFIKQLELLWQA